MAQRKTSRRLRRLTPLEEEARRQRQIARNQAAIALIESWIEEDAAGDPEAQEAEWEDFKAALNANRAAAGESPLFP
jgi:hypothetical protein